MIETADFYRLPSPTSDLGRHREPQRMSHMQAVGAEAIVGNVISLDPSPLGLKRPAERRMVAFCYHFALLHW